MIKAVIFDFFGVLVGQGFSETYRQAGGDPVKDRLFIEDMLGAANRGIISSEEMRQMIIRQLGITYEAWVDALGRSEKPNPALLAYAIELQDRGYKLAILSNANKGTLQRKMTKQQLDIFDELVVSAEVGTIKPDREIYLLAAERLGVQPKECVFTDDIKDYVEAARVAGMKAFLFEDTKRFQDELEQLLADTDN
jgi:epoxide hydrolase-like predicted phosphatase